MIASEGIIKEATMERRFFMNNDEWEYFLTEILGVSYKDATGTDISSVTFSVEVSDCTFE